MLPGFVSVLVIAVMTTGCATLFSGGSADVQIDSEPEGASVYVDGIQRGSDTPSNVQFNHSYSDAFNDEEVTLRLDGYEDRKFKIDHGISGWYWANLLTTVGGAAIGGAVASNSNSGGGLLGAAAFQFVTGLGGVIGSVVDVVTGSWVKVDQTQYSVELRESTGTVGSNYEGDSYSDYMHLSLSELERKDDGTYLIPEPKKPLAVYDNETNNTLIFRSE